MAQTWKWTRYNDKIFNGATEMEWGAPTGVTNPTILAKYFLTSRITIMFSPNPAHLIALYRINN